MWKEKVLWRQVSLYDNGLATPLDQYSLFP